MGCPMLGSLKVFHAVKCVSCRLPLLPFTNAWKHNIPVATTATVTLGKYSIFSFSLAFGNRASTMGQILLPLNSMADLSFILVGDREQPLFDHPAVPQIIHEALQTVVWGTLALCLFTFNTTSIVSYFSILLLNTGRNRKLCMFYRYALHSEGQIFEGMNGSPPTDIFPSDCHEYWCHVRSWQLNS